MLRTITGVIVLVMSLSACGGAARLIRQATYPPDFNYVSGDELRSSMDQLGYQLQRLDQALAPAETGQDVSQQEVLSVLGDIERIGTNLRAGEGGSNHPFLEDHMNDFVVQVGRARIAARMDPPSYYLAGRVAGGCVNCHRVNR
ncbi:MAG: hypothetical protein R3F41_15985 [Gammaproteobacteria bacterium]|nr:hypothetical protein [Pseudomonadales bacterium]MCP5346728.1 hypothetical protein [Pseudomonadales bacterium]